LASGAVRCNPRGEALWVEWPTRRMSEMRIYDLLRKSVRPKVSGRRALMFLSKLRNARQGFPCTQDSWNPSLRACGYRDSIPRTARPATAGPTSRNAGPLKNGRYRDKSLPPRARQSPPRLQQRKYIADYQIGITRGTSKNPSFSVTVLCWINDYQCVAFHSPRAWQVFRGALRTTL